LQAKELVDINLDTKTRRRRLKRRLLRVVIPVGCVLFMIVTILSISAYGYYVNRRDVLVLSDDLLEALDRRIATQVHDYLVPASEMVKLAAGIVQDPSFGIDKDSEIEALAIQILRTYPQLTAFSIAGTRGDFLMPKKMPDGAIHTKNIEHSEAGRRVSWTRRDQQGKIVKVEESLDDSYDPRVRPWYIGAVKNKGLYWTDVYIFFSDQSPGVTASMPVYDQDEKLLGVLGVDIKLAEVSAFLAGLTIGRHGQALIIDKQGHLVAYPEIDRMLKEVAGKLQPVMLNELGDPVLDRAFSRFQIEGPGNRDLMVDNRRYLNTVSSLKSTVGRDWSVMIIVPEDDFVGFVGKNFRTILMMTSVIVILASLLAGLLVFQGLRADRNAKLVLDRKQELEAQSRAFSELASKAAMFDPADTESLGELTKIVSTAVTVRRTSAWHFVDDGKQLLCDDCYDRESSGHTQGTLLERDDYLQLFDALQQGEEIVISDAADDPMLSELYRVYLHPLGCRSLLAVPVTLDGQTAGTIWFEHEGKARVWGSEDISFARAIAGMLALRLAAEQKPETSLPVQEAGSDTTIDSVSVKKASAKSAPAGRSESSANLKPATSQPTGKASSTMIRSDFLADIMVDRGYDRHKLRTDVFTDTTVFVLRFTDPLSLARDLGEGQTTTVVDQLICHLEDMVISNGIDYWKIMSDQIVCATGLGDDSNAHTHTIADFALGIQHQCIGLFADLDERMEFRIGIDRGAVVGSTLGRHHKSYNIWGDAVTVALTMADTALAGSIHVSEAAYLRLRTSYLLRVRGSYYLKDVGEISTYLLTGKI
jgi:adenylate cyclase